MTLEKLLWKIPQYRRRKVIEVVDDGEKELRNLPVYDTIGYARYLLDETVRHGLDDVGNYLRQDKLLRIFNKYQLAERFIVEFSAIPAIDDRKIVALIGNLYSDYVAGNMWADGMNPDPQNTGEKLDQKIYRWTRLLSEIDLADAFNYLASKYKEKLGR